MPTFIGQYRLLYYTPEVEVMPRYLLGKQSTSSFLRQAHVGLTGISQLTSFQRGNQLDTERFWTTGDGLFRAELCP